jgi:hypothetical protein
LTGQLLTAQPQCGEDSRDHDSGRALDVVVEARHLVPVPFEQAQGVVLLEVLPLQEGVGITLFDRLHERGDERVVGGAP